MVFLSTVLHASSQPCSRAMHYMAEYAEPLPSEISRGKKKNHRIQVKVYEACNFLFKIRAIIISL